jgi:hypothetical protein
VRPALPRPLRLPLRLPLPLLFNERAALELEPPGVHVMAAAPRDGVPGAGERRESGGVGGRADEKAAGWSTCAEEASEGADADDADKDETAVWARGAAEKSTRSVEFTGRAVDSTSGDAMIPIGADAPASAAANGLMLPPKPTRPADCEYDCDRDRAPACVGEATAMPPLLRERRRGSGGMGSGESIRVALSEPSSAKRRSPARSAWSTSTNSLSALSVAPVRRMV